MQPNTAIKKLASQVTTLRTGRGYSISQLSDLKTCGVSESTLRRIENAHVTGYNPKLSTLVQISEVLNLPVSALIGQLKQVQNTKVGKVSNA